MRPLILLAAFYFGLSLNNSAFADPACQALPTACTPACDSSCVYKARARSYFSVFTRLPDANSSTAAPVQNQKQPSVEQLALLTVRSRIADSALVMQGAIESISEDHASMNWSTARLAVVRPTRIFRGNSSTKYEVLVPMDTRLGEEVANGEGGRQALR